MLRRDVWTMGCLLGGLLFAACAPRSEDVSARSVESAQISTVPRGPVCDPIVCTPPEQWDEAECKCVKPICDPIVCTPPEQWDEAECKCVKPVCDPIKCPPPEVWDETDCKCIRPPV